MVVFEIWKSGCYREVKFPKCIIFSKNWWLSNYFEITPKPYFFFGSQTQTIVSCEHFDATKNRLWQTNCGENLVSKQIFASIKRNTTIFFLVKKLSRNNKMKLCILVLVPELQILHGITKKSFGITLGLQKKRWDYSGIPKKRRKKSFWDSVGILNKAVWDSIGNSEINSRDSTRIT